MISYAKLYNTTHVLNEIYVIWKLRGPSLSSERSYENTHGKNNARVLFEGERDV